MRTERRSDGWWIVGVPDSVVECGPYATKADAESDRVGMARFFRHWDKPAWMNGPS